MNEETQPKIEVSIGMVDLGKIFLTAVAANVATSFVIGGVRLLAEKKANKNSDDSSS